MRCIGSSSVVAAGWVGPEGRASNDPSDGHDGIALMTVGRNDAVAVRARMRSRLRELGYISTIADEKGE